MTPSIPSSSITKFFMASPPVGWTKITTMNDYSVRVTSGTTSTGGSTPFSTTFVSKTATGTRSMTIATDTILAGAGVHGHTNGSRYIGGSSTVSSPTYTHPPTLPAPTQTIFSWPTLGSNQSVSGTTGGSGGHSHTLTAPATLNGPVTGATVNFAVNYVDVILGQRN